MKEGDKVICIKDFKYSSEMGIFTYKSGNIYKVCVYEYKNRRECVYINSEEYYSDITYGIWFTIGEGKFRFSDYFNTISKFREDRINSILDGD